MHCAPITPSKYPSLKLPAAQLQIRAACNAEDLEVYDNQRSKWVILTPEEWVRQHFVSMLVNSMGYPASRIANEVSISYNGVAHRCDTIVYGADRAPWMIVEYKAPTVKISRSVFRQIARYNLVAHAQYLAVTNGFQHYVCRVLTSGDFEFLDALPQMIK